MSAPVFRRVRAGYEPAAVDRHLHQLDARLGAAEDRTASAEREIAARDAALAEVRAELAAARRQAHPDLMASDVVVEARRHGRGADRRGSPGGGPAATAGADRCRAARSAGQGRERGSGCPCSARGGRRRRTGPSGVLLAASPAPGRCRRAAGRAGPDQPPADPAQAAVELAQRARHATGHGCAGRRVHAGRRSGGPGRIASLPYGLTYRRRQCTRSRSRPHRGSRLRRRSGRSAHLTRSATSRHRSGCCCR